MPIGLATYDVPTRTVTLVPLRRLSLNVQHVLVVKGSGEGGITSQNGNLLDGDADGEVGGDAVTFIGPQNLAGSAYNNRPAPRRHREGNTTGSLPTGELPRKFGQPAAGGNRRPQTPRRPALTPPVVAIPFPDGLPLPRFIR